MKRLPHMYRNNRRMHPPMKNIGSAIITASLWISGSNLIASNSQFANHLGLVFIFGACVLAIVFVYWE
jgi:predicted RND superfamily exporter protein